MQSVGGAAVSHQRGAIWKLHQWIHSLLQLSPSLAGRRRLLFTPRRLRAKWVLTGVGFQIYQIFTVTVALFRPQQAFLNLNKAWKRFAGNLIRDHSHTLVTDSATDGRYSHIWKDFPKGGLHLYAPILTEKYHGVLLILTAFVEFSMSSCPEMHWSLHTSCQTLVICFLLICWFGPGWSQISSSHILNPVLFYLLLE